MSFPAYNLLVGVGVATGFLVGDAALKGHAARGSWPYLCLLALGSGLLGAVGFSYYAGVTESWHRPAFTFLGGACAALVALAIFSWSTGLDTLAILDAAALAICPGHALGRLGCFFGGCCYGRVINLAPAVNLSFTFPSPLVESGIEMVIFIHLKQISSAVARKPGLLAARWMLLYGLARLVMEFARGDFRGALPFNSGGMSPSQCLSLALLALGVVGQFMFIERSKEVVAL